MKANFKVYLFLLPALLYVLLFSMYPLIYNVYLSLQDVTFTTFIQGTAQYTGLENYRALLDNPTFQRTFTNTLIFTFLSIFFQFLIGFLLSLLFNRSFPLKGILQSLIMVPWVLPIIVSGSFCRWFFSDKGMFNGFLLFLGIIARPIPWITSGHLPIYSVTLANIWLGIPFNFVLLYTGLRGIPLEFFESAEIDGASGYQKIRYVILPLLKPVMIATLTLGSIFTVKVFDLVWIITMGGPAGVSHLFSTFSYFLAFSRFDFGQASGVLVIMLIIVVALTAILNLSRAEEV
ncbi:MAG TPA: sugar ABC transporter permease [Atribacteraceae bacterium]|nr:sugar ABC transporter permease [Atribacteraceae bacterium]